MTQKWGNHGTLAVALLLLTMLAACAPARKSIIQEKPTAVSAQELVSNLEARSQEVKSFTAKGRVTVLTPERRYNGTALITAIKPSTLRVDVLSFFGQPVVTFVTDGREVKLLAYTEGKIYRGPATPRNLALFIPPQVTVPEVIAFMSGSVPLQTALKPELAAEPGQSRYRVDLATPESGDRLTLWVGDQDLEIRMAQWLDDTGQVLFRVEFEDFSRQGGAPQPQQVNLTSGAGDRRIKLHYQNFTPNPPQVANLMSLPSLEGLQETVLPQ